MNYPTQPGGWPGGYGGQPQQQPQQGYAQPPSPEEVMGAQGKTASASFVGSPPIKWEGKLVGAAQTVQQRETDNTLKFWEDGRPKWALVVKFQSGVVDESSPDGVRSHWLTYHKAAAVKKAVEAAGDPSGVPKDGGWLSLEYFADDTSRAPRRGESAAKLFRAEYRMPDPYVNVNMPQGQQAQQDPWSTSSPPPPQQGGWGAPPPPQNNGWNQSPQQPQQQPQGGYTGQQFPQQPQQAQNGSGLTDQDLAQLNPQAIQMLKDSGKIPPTWQPPQQGPPQQQAQQQWGPPPQEPPF